MSFFKGTSCLSLSESRASSCHSPELGKNNNTMLILPNLFSINQIFVSSNRVLISLFPEREMVSITVSYLLIKRIFPAAHVRSTKSFHSAVVPCKRSSGKSLSAVFRGSAKRLHVSKLVLRNPPHSCKAHILTILICDNNVIFMCGMR